MRGAKIAGVILEYRVCATRIRRVRSPRKCERPQMYRPGD
ncbi:hypothetical protein EBME_1160 [bacterium endosymbiont of Mortierella elongata FMR23-6]|nr:hypothetical protein EBME_1160 [bacterium endosymbiont of Mortierella elongata FMR23-6]